MEDMHIKTLGEIRMVEKREPTQSEVYDARMTHSGFGAPDCSCHIAPPCQACVDWTNTCDEKDFDKDGGCIPNEHDCPIGRGEIRA